MKTSKEIKGSSAKKKKNRTPDLKIRLRPKEYLSFVSHYGQSFRDIKIWVHVWTL